MPVLQLLMSPKRFVQAVAWDRLHPSPTQRLEKYLQQLATEVALTRAAFTEQDVDPEDYNLDSLFDPDSWYTGRQSDAEMESIAKMWAGAM